MQSSLYLCSGTFFLCQSTGEICHYVLASEQKKFMKVKHFRVEWKEEKRKMTKHRWWERNRGKKDRGRKREKEKIVRETAVEENRKKSERRRSFRGPSLSCHYASATPDARHPVCRDAAFNMLILWRLSLARVIPSCQSPCLSQQETSEPTETPSPAQVPYPHSGYALKYLLDKKKAPHK